MSGYMYAMWHMCGGQITGRSKFPSSTMWVPGINLSCQSWQVLHLAGLCFVLFLTQGRPHVVQAGLKLYIYHKDDYLDS